MTKNYIDRFGDDTQIYIFDGVNHKISACPYVLYIKGNNFVVDKVPILKKGTLYDEYGDTYEIIYHESDVCERELIDSKTIYVKTTMGDRKESLSQLKRARKVFWIKDRYQSIFLL